MQFETAVGLAPHTTIGLGGPARYFARARQEEDILAALAFAEERRQAVYVLGGGSNLVVADRGVDGLVLAIELRGLEVRETREQTLLIAGAGEPWDQVVKVSLESGLSGLECLSGIPGLVGATPIQNVGAYGREVADTLVEVRAYDRTSNRFVTLGREDCRFAYRNSRFKAGERDRFIITQVSFCLERGGPTRPRYPELERVLGILGHPPTPSEVREAVLQLRRGKSMLLETADENSRSCGSFFVNPVVSEERADSLERRFAPLSMPRYREPRGYTKLSAAWLIEQSGFPKGTRFGNVGISSRHALALVCHATATTEELLRFADKVRDTVQERTGVRLTPEPAFW